MGYLRKGTVINALREDKQDTKMCYEGCAEIEYGKEGQGSPPQGSATEQLAIKRVELEQKCKTIEQTAIDTDAELYQWILEGVTSDYATYRYLRDAKGMPCCKNIYYEQRRRFYWLLSKKI